MLQSTPTDLRLCLRILAAALFVAGAGGLPARGEVDLAVPYEGPAKSGSLPLLDVDGVLFDAPPSAVGATSVHGGRFTLFSDTTAPPGLDAVCPDLLPKPFDTEAAPALALHWNEALAEADASVSKLDGGSVQDFFDAFETAIEYLGGDVDVKTGPTTQRCVSWQPVQGRFLRSQWMTSGLQVPWKPSKFYAYHQQPTPFRELRERGARLYCAARTAQFAQGDAPHSMGERVGFSVNVLGATVDFLVVEPTMVLDGPERFTGDGAENGAQAFGVPMLLGTRITPIRGLPLPGFREVRVPVSLVTGDTEVRNASESGPVFMGSDFQCSWKSTPPYVVCAFIPRFETKYREDHLTITHLDALRTAQKYSTITGETEVMRIGPVAVELGFGVEYFFGVATPGNDRVLDLAGLASGARRPPLAESCERGSLARRPVGASLLPRRHGRVFRQLALDGVAGRPDGPVLARVLEALPAAAPGPPPAGE